MADVARILGGLVDTVYRNAKLADFTDTDELFVEAQAGEIFAGYRWDGETFSPPPPEPPVIPDRVTSRQFKLQLLASGLIDAVDAWIASQDRAVQLAYEYSGTFVRDEPMMVAGFAALGFTDPQIDAFFAAAAEL